MPWPPCSAAFASCGRGSAQDATLPCTVSDQRASDWRLRHASAGALARCAFYVNYAAVRRNASAVWAKRAAASKKTGPWPPFGTTHSADRGMARYISIAISTG